MEYVLIIFLYLNGQVVNAGMAGPLPDKATCEEVEARELKKLAEYTQAEFGVKSYCLIVPTAPE